MKKTAELPHLIIVERLLGLPVIESALTKSAETYSRVKNSNQLVKWALSTVETTFDTATKQAMPIAAPIVRRLSSTINFVDGTLCWSLDKIEKKIPIIKEKPKQILDNAYILGTKTFTPAISNITFLNDLIVEQVKILRDVAHKKANEILSTRYGCIFVKGVDSVAAFIDKLIDRYFLSIKDNKKVTPAEEDKLLHVIQTISYLCIRTSKRIYVSVVHNWNIIKKDYLIPFINRLVEFFPTMRCILKLRGKSDKKIQTEKEEKLENKKSDNKESENKELENKESENKEPKNKISEDKKLNDEESKDRELDYEEDKIWREETSEGFDFRDKKEN